MIEEKFRAMVIKEILMNNIDEIEVEKVSEQGSSEALTIQPFRRYL